MDITMDFSTVNWLAVLIATVSGFLLGGVWYSPLFLGRFLPSFMADVESRTGVSHNIAWTFSAGFVLLWAAASFLAGLLGPHATARDGLDVGLGIGLLFVFPALGISAIFGSRPIRMAFISGGFFIACYALMGAILGALR